MALLVAASITGLPRNVRGAAPAVSQEFTLDQVKGGGPLPGDQSRPDVAFNGTNYAVVWQDAGRIHGLLLTTTGAVVEPIDFEVRSADVVTSVPAIATDGRDFLVAWVEGYNVKATRVSAAGAVLDSTPLSFGTSYGEHVSVAFGGGTYLVVWDAGSTVAAHRVSSAGQLVGVEIVARETSTGGVLYPDVAWDGQQFFAAWQDERDGATRIYGQRIQTSGAVLDGEGFAVSASNDAANPSIACGTNCYVVWAQFYSDGVLGRHVTTAGAPVESTDVVAVLQPSAIQYSRPDLCTSPRGGYYLGYSVNYGSGESQLAFAELDASGKQLVADPPRLTPWLGGSMGYAAIATDGQGALLVWSGSEPLTDVGSEVFGALIDGTGAVVQPAQFHVSIGQTPQRGQAFASDGKDFLVVWQQQQLTSGVDVWAARVSAFGSVLDPGGIVVTDAPDDQVAPDVAFDGKQYVIVWQSRSDIYAARIDTAGAVLDPSGIAISSGSFGETEPSIAGFASGSWIVWSDERGSNADIYGTALSQSGSLTHPNGVPISTADYDQRLPRVACNSATCFALWRDGRTGGFYHVYGSRLDITGNALDLEGVPLSANGLDALSPSVASDGSSFLAAWQETSNGADQNILAVQIGANGSVSSPLTVATGGTTLHRTPRVAYDGFSYVITWQDEDEATGTSDVHATRVDGKGVLLDPESPPIAADSNADELAPAIAANALGQSVIGYVRNDAENADGRVRGRVVSWQPGAAGSGSGGGGGGPAGTGGGDGGGAATSGSASGGSGAASEDDAGCGCRLGSRGRASAGVWLAALLLLVRTRRRKSSARASTC